MTVQDPVCGRHIDLDEVYASEEHEGWEYFFCSAVCHRRFRLEPAAFASAPKPKNHHSTEKKAS
ncbi:MAG: YHS domain-containing protein [Roseitalea sp.]|nr:YHS domain-containing protein [Roseitalea sp.]MBO6720695.1 YHS domain-containing protein [Roseitalea sp.]MBO6743842.1 YHS domain-containing protein [Roseitalea sp.]